ncbi:MAG TPA: fibronectin type III domain-containing protein, partial [Candidatus Saccharimonas sp.]|nr:fibronectin type III domain-containing protein [Candidatus Saccharimonas sp.]
MNKVFKIMRQPWHRVRSVRFGSALIVTIGLLVAGLVIQPWAQAAPPSFVQTANVVPAGNANTIVKAFTSPNTAGNLIVAAATWDGSSSQGSFTCTDSLANTYATAATQLDTANGQWLGVCYAANVKSGANTVTARLSASRPFRRMVISEYAGVATTSPLDVTAKQAAAGTTAANAITSTAATTTAAGDLIFGAVMDTTSTTTIAAGTGFTQRGFTNNKDLATQDMIQASAGSVASTQTFGAAHRYDAIMVAFKPAVVVPDTTPPSAPTGLAATATSQSQINLSWTASTDNVGVTGYRVERCQGAGCTSFAQVATPSTTSFSDTGLAPSTAYVYRVRATDAAGNLGGYSATATATTQGAPDTTPPSVPTNLAGIGTSISQISLTWTASTDNVGVTGYKIFRNGSQINTSTSASYNDSGLAVNTSYSYAVAAYDAAGNTSAQTAAVAVSTLPDTTPPSVPAGLTATPATSTQVNLSWTASTDNVGVTGYKLYRGGVLINTGAATSFSDTGLTPGTTYSYTVSAMDAAANESAQSPAVQATTPAPDTTPPSISMSSPQQGTTISGTVTVSAVASDAGSGVHDVQFFLDG